MLGAQQPAVHINQEKAGRFLRVALTLKEFDLVINNEHIDATCAVAYDRSGLKFVLVS